MRHTKEDQLPTSRKLVITRLRRSKIHPDLRDEFVKIFSESAKEAKLCTDNGTTLDFNLPVSANTDLPSIEEEESTTLRRNMMPAMGHR